MNKRADYRFRRASHLAAQAHGLYGLAPWAMLRGMSLGKHALPSFRPLKLQLRLSGFRAHNQRQRWINQHTPTDWQQWQWNKRDNVKRTLRMRRAGLHV